MNRTVLFAALAASAMIGFAVSEEPSRSEFQPAALRVGAPIVGIPTSAAWKLESDRKLDGELEATTSLVLLLEFANNQFVGRGKDQRTEGKGNNSVFSGQVIPASPALVTLRQDDRFGQTAVYVGRLVAEGRVVGSYVDNRGLAGDWSLTLLTEQIIERSAAKVPDEALFASVLGVYGKAIRGDRQPFINLRPPHRNLWTDEIKEVVEPALTYGEVDYIGTAKLVIPESGTYTLDMPGAGVEFRLNDQRIDAGDVELQKGLYEVEIYTNHWGQPYLTYAQVGVTRKGSKVQVPLVNTASDIEAFRAKKIAGRPPVEVCKYTPERVTPK